MYADGITREVVVASLHASVIEPVSCLHFSTSLEVLWAGSETGGLYALQCQTGLQRYTCMRGHEGRVHDMRAVGDGIVSVSGDRLRRHTIGGLSKANFMQEQVGDLAACEIEPGSASRVVLGREHEGLMVYDLDAQRLASTAEALAGALMLRAPAGRGLVAIGNAAGQLQLADPRNGYHVEHTATAHSGGLAALDARGNFVATCGYSMRLGRVSQDSMVKVFDLRAVPRLLNTVPFRPGPSLLSFHPKFSSTLLIGSQGGVFTLSDIQGATAGPTYQIETEGDAVTCCAFSSSGEMMAFGGSGGYVHLWATAAAPRVNMMSHPLDFPPVPTKPPVLYEQDPFALPFPYGMTQGKLLSDFSFPAPMQMIQPPRVVPPSLLKDVKQVEFVGYVANPMFKRGLAPGEATKAVAPLRNLRVKPKQALNPSVASYVSGGRGSGGDSPKKRGPRGSMWLPSRYKLQHVHVRRQAGLRWADEFDFSCYNRTRFAGLENGVANCYVNSLVQVLFFIPAIRKTMLSMTPDPEKEFSLSCEMSLLFRMLCTARGAVCQASNLFRALRQNKEAAALGLLEGQTSQPSRDSDLQVETQKERTLRSRIQSLQIFLFEQLHRELMQVQAENKQSSHADASSSHATASSGASSESLSASDAAAPPSQSTAASAAAPDLSHAHAVADAAAEPSSTQSSAADLQPATQTDPPQTDAQMPHDPDKRTVIDQCFGIMVRQRTRCLSQGQAEKFREFRSFQVDLQYPSAKDRPALHTMASSAADHKRPRFCDVLARSLQPQAELRAWFDEQRGYQHVQQTRLPLKLPNVLALSCGLSDSADLAWWQPWQTAPGPRPWLPWAIAVQVRPEVWKVDVQEADSPGELLKQQQGASPEDKATRAVYELTAVVAHVMDATEESSAGHQDGHLVAHVKVLPQDIDPQYGIAHSPLGPSPSQSPLARPFGPAPTAPQSAYTSAVARTASLSNSGNLSRLSRSTSQHSTASHTASDHGAADSAKTGSLTMAGGKSGDREFSSSVPQGSGLLTPVEEVQTASERTDSEELSANAETASQSQTEASQEGADDWANQAPSETGSQTDSASAVDGLTHAANQGRQLPAESPFDKTELKQSKLAIHRGEDQAMQESLAAANAAAGDRVQDGLKATGQESTAQASSAPLAELGPGQGVSSPRAMQLPAEGKSTLAEPAESVPTAASQQGSSQQAHVSSTEQQAGAGPGDGAGSGLASSSPAPGQDKSQLADRYRNLSLVAPPPEAGAGLVSDPSRGLSDGLPPSPSSHSPVYRQPEWLLCNDFCIMPCAPAEVVALYGNQKVPCLLYYSRVDRALTAAELSAPPAAPSPVLTSEAFQALCRGPPVQAPCVKQRLRSFTPLGPEELPGPGVILGIDAEFVAHWPAQKVMQGGVEVEVCKARLGLARVSVVRGEGPLAGTPAIDDYIRSLETITDYLTKWSGLVPGDLDPKASPHYLTSMKKAYLKLRYLVDQGCIFVGHDLRHDFKSINIVVPAQQVIDTVFLFHFKRQRKLSLRFLASFLLKEDIQQETHDSIEDACTAVKLYQKYKQLVAEGKFQETLLEMYRWGKQHGWDPAAAKAHGSAA